MKLQLALDGRFDQSIKVLEKVQPFIDIAELGTPQIIHSGMTCVHQYLERFPGLPLLADLKIMDAGEFEAAIAYEAGCQYVTVLGVSADATIQGVVAAARRFNAQVVVDMIEVDDVVQRGKRLVALGCDILCLHTAYDQQSSVDSPLSDLKRMKEALSEARLAIAGGVNLHNIDEIVQMDPEIVVVGGAIFRAQEPEVVAEEMCKRMKSR